MLRVEPALVGGRERRRSEFVITTPILSNHWKNVFMDARIENTRRKCARKLVNGLTLNILDKCRQGLNLSTKRSNALCGTIFNYSPLSTSAWLWRSKSTVFAWSSSERLATKCKNNSWKNSKLGVTSPRQLLAALPRTNPFNASRCSAWSRL